MTKSFEIKHEKLVREENDLREKLQNEVTKIKENLEKFLSESNRLVKNTEKIQKGIKQIENEKENMIKKISYVSKINKYKKEIKMLFGTLMKNIKISFIEKECDIKYDEYYFNGIQIPKDIEFKDIKKDSFKIFWKIDKINLINRDDKQIKYRVELRRENKNEKFKQAYEGNNSNCLIENLKRNKNYEIRICCVYGNLIGLWSEIQKVKTSKYDCDSIILEESGRKNEFSEIILKWCGFSGMELLYRGSRDGTTSRNFHNRCDNKGPTICLYKNDKKNIFGGYTSIPWTTDGKHHKSNDCFLFTLTNIYGIEPTIFPYKNNSESVFHRADRGPNFGNNADIWIQDDYKSKNSESQFPSGYLDILKKGKSIFTGDYNNNNTTLIIKEIEVFKLY